MSDWLPGKEQLRDLGRAVAYALAVMGLTLGIFELLTGLFSEEAEPVFKKGVVDDTISATTTLYTTEETAL